MQILEIVLFDRSGRKRTLKFQPGRVNVITGDSNTGKSELIAILDYCLARRSCPVAKGVIRDTVAWYGVRLQWPAGQMFIARRGPEQGAETHSAVYLEEGDEIPSPERPPTPNTTADELAITLTNRIGIAPNLNTPPRGQTRRPLAATIRHASLLCFQHQTEIDQRDVLFHRGAQQEMKLAAKDTLPYFLGAIREDQLALEQELIRAKRDLNIAQRELREAQQVRGQGVSRAVSLLAEARAAGMLDDDVAPSGEQDTIEVLQQLSQWLPETFLPPGSDTLVRLQADIAEVRQQWAENAEAMRAAKSFADEAEGYAAEGAEQELRLQSIGLFDDISDHEADTCPVCSQHLPVPLPTTVAIRHSLEQLRANLTVTAQERPRLREYIESLETEKERLRLRLRGLNAELDGATREQQAALRIRDTNIRRAQVVGRITFWLESRQETGDHSALEERVARAGRKVVLLEEQLNTEARDERLSSILNRIGRQMTEWATTLGLEHAGSPVRLDLKNVTVVVDGADGPIPLGRMGSGENWVAYHLITYLALQQHFRQQGRPVPDFVVFDQPSQAYYPPDMDPALKGAMEGLADEDRIALQRMYGWIFDVVESLAPGLQVIVTDHASLTSPRFQSAIVETWRGGNALIPQEWLTAQAG